MKHVHLIFVFVLCLVYHVTGQVDQTNSERNSQGLEFESVYLRSECRAGSGIRVRLLNDTRWAISVSTFSLYVDPRKSATFALLSGRKVFLLPSDQEIKTIFYSVEREKTISGKRYLSVISNSGHVSSVSWIAPRSSIYFTVAEQDLLGLSTTYVAFNYEWERNKKGGLPDQVSWHRAIHPGRENEGGGLEPCN